MPQLHKANRALDTLFIRGRHMQISTWVSSQKLRLISAAVRVNQQFICCWRLRNQHELDAVIEELSALLPKDKLHRIYEQATRDPYSFLFVYYLKPKNEMFYLRFEERFEKPMGAALSFLGQKLFASSTLINARCENISCASGAQCCTSVAAVQSPIIRRTGGFLRKGMTTIYVDSRKRVAGSDSDFEVDLGESLHPQSDARLAVYKIRIADSFLSLPLLGGRRARHAELGAPSGRRLHGLPAGSLDQLQLRHCRLQRDHEQPQRSLRRQPPHSERSGAAAAVP